MEQSKLKGIFHDAPQWFWDCPRCSQDPYFDETIAQRQEWAIDGSKSAWQWAEPVFNHFHFSLRHHKFNIEGHYEMVPHKLVREKVKAAAQKCGGRAALAAKLRCGKPMINSWMGSRAVPPSIEHWEKLLELAGS